MNWVSIALTVFLGGQGLAQVAQAAPRPAQPEKLEHMDYYRARKIILGYGWKPVPGRCGGNGMSENACANFPEIATCSGVWPANCAMVFAQRNRCLYVMTYGGEPEGDSEGDTHVETVTFRRGPCSKN
jgi:hypothetical protein